jgi:hypothetical protein
MADHLPALPWSYEITALEGEHEGAGHVYIVDATGRKIASIWGKPDEKIAVVQLIMDAAVKEKTSANG